MNPKHRSLFLNLLGCGLVSAALHAETGASAWLRYAPLDDGARQQYRAALPAEITAFGNSPVIASAQHELIRGVRGMLARTLRIEPRIPAEGAVVLASLADLQREAPQFGLAGNLEADGFWLKSAESSGVKYTIVAGANERGVLYGAFALLRKIALGQPIENLDEKEEPYAPVRWINQWDNLDGSIERGYAGRSIFWANGHAREDLSRVAEYGRLLASLGINGCSINNVNADPRMLTPAFTPQIARIAAALRPWGVRVAVSVDFGSPQTVGGLATFDPLDKRVAAWWTAHTSAIYRAAPDLAGFVLKADSEGRVGPSTYGRTHADAANVVARALKPHGGLLFYRGFVYDHHADWRNRKNDRARAAYDNFHPLDGRFDDNVVVQIKNGPIDFQIREPASALFAGLAKTNQAVELQITQEYMGQARALVFLVPMWKETLDFQMDAPVKAIVSGRTFHRPIGGFVGVANVGLDDNWLGNHLSQANLYGFGRLAWNPDLSARQIAEEWTRLTFGSDSRVIDTITGMQLASWRVYENYTGPLGLQGLTDITGNHYGVNVEASERNGWGQWHRADEHDVGMDRTVATGTGYIGQYPPAAAKLYESLETCPDDLLLFMHHVPYTHVLHDGKTVIQYLYDSHYEGAEAAENYVRQWKLMAGRMDEQRYREVLAQLEYQAGQAQVWRDAVNNWFFRESGIADSQGRVGQHPNRVEAESMKLEAYTAVPVTPWEAASGGEAIICPLKQCAASYRYDGSPGWYTLRVQYFDQNNGVAHYRLRVGEQLVDEWVAADHVPTGKIDGSSSTRRTVPGIALRPGDEIRVEGIPDGEEFAAVDYIEIQPDTNCRVGMTKPSPPKARTEPYRNPDLPAAKRVKDLLPRMTLEEKAAQMMCVWQQKANTLLNGDGDFDLAKAKAAFKHKRGLGQVGRPSDAGKGKDARGMAELTNAIQKFFLENSRLGIPVMFHEECLHGHAAIGGTSFPQPIALAATFHPELVESLFTMTAAEARLRGTHQALTPVVDVARDPRWGRVEETYGEDPYLVSRLGIAAVRGFQGDAQFLDKRRVIATLKHFAGHGQPESGMNCAPANVSMRVLRETFLYTFKEALDKGGAISVMASYNEIDGVPSHANRWLLGDLLRKEFGFRGFVVSDYYAIWELGYRPDTHGHFVAKDKREACALAVRAGVNIELPEPDCYLHLVELVRKGVLKESQLDGLVAPMLYWKFQMRLFDDPYVDPDEADRVVGCEEHRQLALQGAREAITLLRNENGVLPLDLTKLRSIAVIGPNAHRSLLGGYSGVPKVNVTVLDGIREKVGSLATVLYSEGCKITIGGSWNQDEVVGSDPEEDRKQIAAAVEVAREADIIVLAIGGNEQTSREAWGLKHMGDRTSLDLIGRQEELVKAMLATGKPVIVLLFNGRPLSINYVSQNVPAILECWYLGQETGRAVADVLFGDFNPGGKLPITVPRSAGHLPAFYNYKPSARRGYLFDDVSPLYAFGYGLSYTVIVVENVRLLHKKIRADGATRVLADVTNTGSREGTEVVQMYIRDLVSSVTRPVKELKGFKKVSLRPGETKTVTLDITPELLAFYDVNMKYVVEPGEFEIMVGNSSRDADLKKAFLTVG